MRIYKDKLLVRTPLPRHTNVYRTFWRCHQVTLKVQGRQDRKLRSFMRRKAFKCTKLKEILVIPLKLKTHKMTTNSAVRLELRTLNLHKLTDRMPQKQMDRSNRFRANKLLRLLKNYRDNLITKRKRRSFQIRDQVMCLSLQRSQSDIRSSPTIGTRTAAVTNVDLRTRTQMEGCRYRLSKRKRSHSPLSRRHRRTPSC